MPIHDWTTVLAGDFQHFHQDWSIEIARQLNRGILPKGYEAATSTSICRWSRAMRQLGNRCPRACATI